jgi:hypothetical protein
VRGIVRWSDQINFCDLAIEDLQLDDIEGQDCCSPDDLEALRGTMLVSTNILARSPLILCCATSLNAMHRSILLKTS